MPDRLSEDAAWAFLADAPVGVFTTLRRDGMPMSFPVWFAVVDRTVCISTRPGQKKVARLRHDPRASFVAEAGTLAVDLKGVHLTGRVAFVEDPAEIERIADALEEKYLDLRTPEEKLPEAYQRRNTGRVLLRLVPDPKVLSWDFSGRYAGR